MFLTFTIFSVYYLYYFPIIFFIPLTLFGQDQETIWVKVSSANIRECPGLKDCKVVYNVSRSTKLKLLEKQEDWFLVEYLKDKKGWIHNTLISYTPISKDDVIEGTVTDAEFELNGMFMAIGLYFKLKEYPGYEFHITSPGIMKGMKIRLYIKDPLTKEKRIEISKWEQI
jgi:hypothetical protein